MERRYRSAGRARLGRASLDDYRRSERDGYLDYEPPIRDSYLGSPDSGSYRSGRSSYDRERADIMESLLQQRALQQQLSLRESQLALASSLLQQQQQPQFFSKRRMSPRGRDPRQDFKRPRLMDDRSRPRNQSTGAQDWYARRRGARGGASNRRNQRPSPRASRGHSSDPSKSKDPERPTADEGGEGSKFRCKPCGVEYKDEEELQMHMSSSEHKDRKKKPYCDICDVVINNVNLQTHLRYPFHKKRQSQVTKGCGWCDVTSFKNFTEVLKHRATDQHIKNQNMYDKRGNRGRDSKRDSRDEGRSQREREPVKVELPPELDKFNPEVVVGQTCVVDVAGWFCKLCNKFYNSETAAKETHCMTEPHFKNYKKFVYNKLRAKAVAERDAKEKAAEEERKKKEAEEKIEADKEEPSSEQAEGDHEETADREGKEQEGEEEVEENGVAEEEEAHAEGEEGFAEGEEEAMDEEEAAMDEEEGEEMIGEPEEYVDDDEAAAAEKEGLLESQEGGEDLAGTEDVENVEGTVQEEAPQAVEEPMEAEIEADAGGEEEEEEEATQKKATRATVSSPGRGRGRGGGTGRARRGRRVAK